MDNTHPTPRSTKKAGVIGGALGTIGIVASIFALSATAGAAPSLVAQDTEPEAPAPVEDVVDDEVGDDNYELPPEFAAAEKCYDDVFSKFDLAPEAEEDNLDEAQWEALDAEAAACEDLLPQDVQDQLAEQEVAFEAYDTCLNEAFEGLDAEFAEGEFSFGPMVMVDTGDTYSTAEFGEGNGTVTITKTGDEITVNGTGDVTVENIDLDALFDEGDIHTEGVDLEDGANEDFDFSEYDEAFENALAGCEDKLPEDIDPADLGIVLDEGDLEEAETN